MQQVVIGHQLLIAEHWLLAQAAQQQRHAPAGGQIAQHAAHIHLAIPRNAQTLFEREHQQIAMVIDRADRDAGAAHDTFIGEAGHMGSNFIRNRRPIQIGNIDHSGERNRAGTHTAVATDAHIDLEAYLFLSQRLHICPMSQAHRKGLFCRLYLHNASLTVSPPSLINKSEWISRNKTCYE